MEKNVAMKMGPEEALRLIVATENTSGHHQKANLNEIMNLKHDLTLGRWTKPHIMVNKKGVVLQGLNHLHAIIQAGKEVFVQQETVVVKRGPRPNRTTSQLLTQYGVPDAPMRLGCLRLIFDTVYDNYDEPSIEKWAELLTGDCYGPAFNELNESRLLLQLRSLLQEKRGRSRLGMAPFLLAYYSSPTTVRNLYNLFCQGGPQDPSHPIAQLVALVKGPIETDEDHIIFMQRAATLLTKAVTGKKLDTPLTDPAVGLNDARAFFQLYQGRLNLK